MPASSDRFELVFDDDAEEYIEQKEKKLAKDEKKAAAERRIIEEKGECEGCGDKEYNRWVYNKENFLCAECFIHDLQCQADSMVPTYRAEDMDGFNEYTCWEDLWENNE